MSLNTIPIYGKDFYVRSDNILDNNHAQEVIIRDCYRLAELVTLEPKLIFDLGSSCGDFAWWASRLFPEAKIISFDGDTNIKEVFHKNAPSATLVNKFIGACYDLPIDDLYFIHQQQVDDFKRKEEGTDFLPYIIEELKSNDNNGIDIFKIDVEGMEVNIFKDIKRHNFLSDIKIITGEWHFPSARLYLEQALGDTHIVTSINEGYWNTFTAIRKDVNITL